MVLVGQQTTINPKPQQGKAMWIWGQMISTKENLHMLKVVEMLRGCKKIHIVRRWE